MQVLTDNCREEGPESICPSEHGTPGRAKERRSACSLSRLLVMKRHVTESARKETKRRLSLLPVF